MTAGWSILLVGGGGAAGSLARYGCALLFQKSALAYPAGTLTANLAGCLVIGSIAQLAVQAQWLTPSARLLLATGFCGGFTTLSSLVYELAQMLRDGEWLHAIAYLNLTVFGGLAAYYLGTLLIKAIWKGV